MKRLMMGTFAVLVPMLAAQTSTPPESQSNPEFKALFQEDQRVRMDKPLSAEERARIVRTDADRLAAVKQMILADQIHTPEDYRNASLILQHSKVSDDYLVAHTLAVICASKGDKLCKWLSAASLDRYLQSIGKSQIYGTQFNVPSPGHITQEPFNADLITDAMRTELGVRVLDDQKKQAEMFRQQDAKKTP